MIEVENLTKRYGLHVAVHNLSFAAQQGEIVGLLGPNGAGKTTTMRILTGFMPPTSGRAIVAGYDVMEQSMSVRQHVGYLPERVPLYPDMTVEGYVSFWAKLRGVRKVRQQVAYVLERVQLSNRRKTLVRNLSKGLKQRLGLAQALVHNPSVVILDEPTIGIDPQQVIEVRHMVRELGNDHTVLFSTHILSEAEQVCDRVVIINHGQIVAQGKPTELRQQLQPETHIYVHIDGADETAVKTILSQIPEITAIEKQGEGWAIRSHHDADIRAQLVEQVLAAGYRILELRPVAMTLEDIFLDIMERTG